MVSGILTYNGQTYNMDYSLLKGSVLNSWSGSVIGNGTLVVSSGGYVGTYSNVPVAEDSNNMLWVWPSEEFSMVSETPLNTPSSSGSGSSGSGTGTSTTTKSIMNFLKSYAVWIIVVVIVILIVYFIVAHKK